MQVFIIGSPLETATALDPKRLRKQIIEVWQILDALNGKSAWSNHPCVLQYRKYEKWLEWYKLCLEWYVYDDMNWVKSCSNIAETIKPPFHTQEYFDQMKRRLYTKNPEHYNQWAHLGRSDENWYWSQEENRFIKYVKGKRIE